MTSYLITCFNQTCKNLISYCISICGYNNNCNCDCVNDEKFINQFCTDLIKPISELTTNNLTNNTNYNTGYNNYKELSIVAIISVCACFICVCLRTKFVIRLANSNIQHGTTNTIHDHEIFNNQNISIQEELPSYNQIDDNPPPTYVTIPKYTNTIMISDNTTNNTSNNTCNNTSNNTSLIV